MPWRQDEEDDRCVDLKNRLFDTVEALYISGIRHFISGMAKGGDFYFCEAVIELREEKQDVTLEAAIPCQGQSSKWSGDDRLRYNKILSQCDFETLVNKEYTANCMSRRNEYMVDNSSILIAAYSGAAGGTMKTMLYAMRQGIEIIELPIYHPGT